MQNNTWRYPDIGETQRCSLVSGLYLNSHLSDFTIFVGENENNACKFPAHQLILCAASPVFRAMIHGPFEEKKLKYTIIKDIPPSVFQKLLMFLYRGILNVTSITEGLELLWASDKYDIDRLRRICFSELLNLDITLENIWGLLTNYAIFDNRLTSSEMKIRMFNFIDGNASDLIRHNKFYQCHRSNVLSMVSRNTFFVSETDLCNAIETWAKMQCCINQTETTPENLKKILGVILYRIRFRLIPPQERRKCHLFLLLTEEERRLIYQSPDKLEPIWNYPLLITPRKECWQWTRDGTVKTFHTHAPTSYFVFARDTFVRTLEIRLKKTTSTVKDVAIHALSEQGINELVKCNFNFENDLLTVSSIFARAFVCHRLEIEGKGIMAVSTDDVDLFGYDDEETVFYSVCDCDIRPEGEQTITSPGYWRQVFGRTPPAHDQGVLFFDDDDDDDDENFDVISSSIHKVTAIFC